MDKLYKSQDNIDLLYEIIATHVSDKFQHDIGEKYDNILQKAIEYVWSKVDHIPPKGYTTDKYLEMMNIKTISLVIPTIEQDLQHLQQTKPKQPPEPLRPMPPPRITTKSSNADAPDINKEYNELIKKRDLDLPQPVQKPLQINKPPSPTFIEPPPSIQQIIQPPPVQLTPSVQPQQQHQAPASAPAPSHVPAHVPAPAQQQTVLQQQHPKPKQIKPSPITLSSKQRDFSIGNINNFVIKVNQKREIITQQLQQNKLIRLSNTVICNIPKDVVEPSAIQIRNVECFVNRIAIPYNKKLTQFPFINLNILNQEQQFIIDNRVDNYIYYKPVDKHQYITVDEPTEIAVKITEPDGLLIDAPHDKIIVKKVEATGDKKIKIITDATVLLQTVALGDKIYCYDTRPHHPTMFNFTSIDGKTQYANCKLEVDKMMYKFSILNADKINTAAQVNFRLLLPQDSENYLYLVYTRNGMSRTEYLKIKDATPEYLILETGLSNTIDIEINAIGYASKSKMGFQNGGRLFNDKGCAVIGIEDNAVIVDAIYDDAYAAIQDGDLFFINMKNQVIIFASQSAY